ncbi:gustatory receptor for bitter taste 66a [Drosophila guanche]|uniref:Gustatory receptor n=1 Tax=Drosophila guanche TaxID=7266 RepID=A0A3B0K490_DROGU|nr:gustatory receptor for bitter taste 66a [Drosophila guanche]SPP87522.1 blast:Gustatory receptor for bitter taste 66a [Drosophila guanche]
MPQVQSESSSESAVQPLLQQFQLLFYISKIAGILPQDLEKFRTKNVLEKSRNGMVYMLAMLIVYVLLYNVLIYSFGEEDRTLKASQSTLTFVIGLFLTYIGLIMMGTDQLTALRNQGRIGELYERIRQVDERLYREKCVVDNSRIGGRIRFMLIMTFLFELSILLATYIKLVDYTQWMSVLWIVSAIPTFINTLDKIWFAVSLYALKERFEAINQTLEELVATHEKFKRWLCGDQETSSRALDSSQPPEYDSNLEYLYKELGSLDMGSLKGSGRNKVAPVSHSMNSFGESIEASDKATHQAPPISVNMAHESELSNASKVEEKLNNLCQVHDEICEIGKAMNELWSYPILSLMAYGFLIFTAQLYFLYCATQFQSIPSLFRSAKNPFITVIALSYTSGKCVYLIYLSWKTSLASKRTGISLHKCGVVADDNLLFEIVNHLSLKLLNHSVDFSACGFFTLDMETLYGVSGGITSYLIILIQFNLAAQQAKEAIQTFNSLNDTASLVGAATEVDNVSSTLYDLVTTTMLTPTG